MSSTLSHPNGTTKETHSKLNDYELQDLDSKPLLQIEEDIMQLARLGEIGAIQKLFDRGFCDAKYADEQGITPLHVGSVFLGVGFKRGVSWAEVLAAIAKQATG